MNHSEFDWLLFRLSCYVESVIQTWDPRAHHLMQHVTKMRYLMFISLALICQQAFGDCIDGNCRNGFGTRSVNGVDYTGKFYQGEITGFALIVGAESYCQANLTVGETAGIMHCYLLDSKVHTLEKSYNGNTKGGLITISRGGEVIGYDVYVDGERQVDYYRTERVKQARLKQDLRGMLSELDQLRAKRPEGVLDWMPVELKTIPGHQVPRYSRSVASRT